MLVKYFMSFIYSDVVRLSILVYSFRCVASIPDNISFSDVAYPILSVFCFCFFQINCEAEEVAFKSYQKTSDLSISLTLQTYCPLEALIPAT